MKNSQKFDRLKNDSIIPRIFRKLAIKWTLSKYDKLRWQESETIRNLLKKQNTFLGGSLENLDHLIYLQKSINLLSLQEICRVMVEKLPFILSVRYFTFFFLTKTGAGWASPATITLTWKRVMLYIKMIPLLWRWRGIRDCFPYNYFPPLPCPPEPR